MRCRCKYRVTRRAVVLQRMVYNYREEEEKEEAEPGKENVEY